MACRRFCCSRRWWSGCCTPSRSRPRLSIGSWPAARFAHVHWRWLALSLVPIFGTYYGRALRWAVFLKPLKPHPSMRNLLSATVIGFTAITLFGRPGEFVRPYLIARKEKVPVTSQFAAWVLERIFDLLMALLLFAFALTRVQSSGPARGAEADLGAGRRRQGGRRTRGWRFCWCCFPCATSPNRCGCACSAPCASCRRSASAGLEKTDQRALPGGGIHAQRCGPVPGALLFGPGVGADLPLLLVPGAVLRRDCQSERW